MNWEYYGRDGADGQYTELYRMPAHLKDGFEKLAAKQRLRKDLGWVNAFDDTALGNDWVTGWFDFEENRLTEAQANALMEDWASRKTWPGRS